MVNFIDKVGVPHSAYDGIVSSGDVTRSVMQSRPQKNVFHIGPERDLPIFDGLDLNFVPMEQAEYVVCTGLNHDEVETPETYRALLTDIRKRNLFMLCGNPDLVVERGDKLIYCAGALADLYASLGGDVLYAGKPHRPIYDLALERVAKGARQAGRQDARAGDRRFHPHRSHRRDELRARLPVRHRGHSRGGTRRPRDAGSGGAGQDVCRRRHRAEGCGAPAGVVARLCRCAHASSTSSVIQT